MIFMRFNDIMPLKIMKGELCMEPKRRFFTSDDISAYMLIAPFFIFFTVFIVIPIIYNGWQSMTNATGLTRRSDFIFLDNYVRLMSDRAFIMALRNTFIFAAASVVPIMALGLAAALALNSKARALRLCRGLMIFPFITSVVSISMVWLILLEPNHGVLNAMLVRIGLSPRHWLFDRNLALPSLIFVNVWRNIGFAMLLFLSGLAGVDPHLKEAAKVDGASDFYVVRKITLPLLRPITIFVFITSVIESFKTFDQVRVMTDGNPLHATTTIVHQIYLRAFGEFQYGYAAAMSMLLLVVVLAVTLVNMRLVGLGAGARDGE